jgi:transcriptional regulator with XRE-family HTH domain
VNLIKTGKFICELRKEKNITQKELANAIHVTDKAVSRWETGKGLPDISLWKPLCEALEISVNELLNGERIKNTVFIEISDKTLIDTVSHTKKQAKVRITVLSILSICLVLFSIITFFLVANNSFFKNSYSTNIGEKKIFIPTPNYSFFIRESGMYGATFKTFKRHDEVVFFIDQYLLSLKKIELTDKTVYYDCFQDITIMNYSFSNSGVWGINNIYISYDIGKVTQ